MKMTLFKIFYYWFALALDLYIKVTTKINKSKNSPKTVCLLKVDGIGDALVWLSAFQALYQYYKEMNYDVILICASPCKVFYEESFDLLKLIEIDVRKFIHFGYRYKILKEIRRLPMDIIINCLYSRTVSVDSIVRVSTAKLKLGNNGDTVNTPAYVKILSDRIYTDLVPQTTEINEMSRNKNLLQWVGIKDYKESIVSLPASFSAESIVAGDYFIVFPGSSSFRKCWPVERFAECCNKIMEKRNWKLIICGGKTEISVCSELSKLITEKDRVINLAGQTTIRQLSSVISKSKLVLTNDTSAVHFAMAWKRPNLCIVMACGIGRFIPYHTKVIEENSIIESAIYLNLECSGNHRPTCNSSSTGVYTCINKITTETVIKEIEIMLEKIGD